jgi:hypothetical protein
MGFSVLYHDFSLNSNLLFGCPPFYLVVYPVQSAFNGLSHMQVSAKQPTHPLIGTFVSGLSHTFCTVKIQQSPQTNTNTNKSHGTRTRRFMTAFMTVCQWFLPWARLIHSTPPPPPEANLPDILSNPILPSMLQSSEWYLSFRLSHQNLVHVSPLSCMPHAPPTSFSLIWSA